ncbi:MAG: transglutaminase domain-containing protein [Oscillospiraceae bacterium]|nr:transglutaminase domain-containing protein [Oscillospiraceae bacterium]
MKKLFNLRNAMQAMFCIATMSVLLHVGITAHAAETNYKTTTSHVEIDAEAFEKALQDAWDEAIQEASWVSTKATTTTKSKSNSKTTTKTTTTQKKSDKNFTKTTTTTKKDSDSSTIDPIVSEMVKKYYASTTTTTTIQSKSGKNSTKTTTATQDKLKYKKYFEKFDPEKTIHLTKSGKILKCDDSKTWYFYHFDDELYNSVGCTGQVLRGASTKDIFCAVIEDNRYLYVTFIPNRKDAKLNDITIESNNNTNEKLNYMFIPENAVFAADLYDTSFRNGIYRITITYDDTEHAYIYLYINCASNDPKDYGFYLCYAEQHDYSEDFDPMERQKYITNLIESEGITPENVIDNSYIVYPNVANKDNCDTPYWIKKAHELLDWYTKPTQMVPAFILHDWMTVNLTYDWYKINERGGYQRYYETRTTADPSQYMSKTKTGVCLDYAIVYTIMCREFDIPCVVLSNSTHAWNAIYINDEWIEVDITADINRYTYHEDLDDVTGTQLYDYSGFMTYDVNNSIPDTATRFCFQ